MNTEELVGMLPAMQTDAELMKSLEYLPPYSEELRNGSTTERFMELSDIYNIYIAFLDI